MIVYFAGVNQIHFCEQFLGRHVLESFADSRPLFGRYRAAFASMILDCGAYTSHRRGLKIDLDEYGDFVAEHGAFYEWCASLDAIAGGVKQNVANWRALTARGLNVVPTFHQGEPVSLLRDYCASAPRVGVGLARDSNGKTRDEQAFLDEVFNIIPAHVKVHGWAMTNYTALYPFESVDSTSWLYELKALRACQTAQQGDPFAHLTDGELIEIIQKRYDRLPRMRQWQKRPVHKQIGLRGIA